MPLFPAGVGAAEYARPVVLVEHPTPGVTDDRVPGDADRTLPALPLDAVVSAGMSAVAGARDAVLPTVPFNREAR